jgi:maltooligosyltrehalose trehalohydrolase
MRHFHRMPFAAELVDEGVRFALWAPGAIDVKLELGRLLLDMPAANAGWRRLVVPGSGAGAEYRFIVDGLSVPDPASRFQPEDVNGPSLVVDPCSYQWQNTGWRGRSWEEAVIYEVHVGTATPDGTYKGLIGKLPELAETGITAIQLMPVAEVPGERNWGYDGVLPFAPESAYGHPDDLKKFIDRAHGLGLMVLLDVVYNHFGPSGNYLHAYAPSFFTERHNTPWGPAINCDGDHAATVRSFFIENALYWLNEFRFDGLRLDAVHAILDDSERHLLDELAARVRAQTEGREIHLILENEANEARWLERHVSRPRAYTAQWDDDLHNAWHVLLTGERDGYYSDFGEDPLRHLGRALAEGFAFQGDMSPHLARARGESSAHLPPQAFVSFLQNHDQIGNRALGERLSHLIDHDRLMLAQAVHLLSPHIPLLFMGEDWSASTPFQFFTGFDGDEDLSAAIREGRRREFSKFGSFADGSVPDPTDPETFIRSKIDWDEAQHGRHALTRERVRDLLALRRDHVVPLLRTRFLGGQWNQPRPNQLDVNWKFEGGGLRLVMNLGEPAEIDAGEGKVIWSTGVSGTAPFVRLAPFGGVVMTFGASA